jgi:hypothetical protein
MHFSFLHMRTIAKIAKKSKFHDKSCQALGLQGIYPPLNVEANAEMLQRKRKRDLRDV